jgi:hypothetical protein
MAKKSNPIKWWIALSVFPPALYLGLILLPFFVPVPPLVEMVFSWIALVIPFVMLLNILRLRKTQAHTELWGVISIILAAAFFGEALFRYSQSQDNLPGFIAAGPSPAGLIVSLLWIGFLDLRKKFCKNPRKEQKIPLIMGALCPLVLIPVIIFSDRRTAFFLYLLVIFVVEFGLLLFAILRDRKLRPFYLAPLLLHTLIPVYALAERLPIGRWFPHSVVYAGSVSAVAALVLCFFSEKEVWI